MSIVQKQKHERILKGLMKKRENMTCADCGGGSATTVDVVHNIFICTQCAGMHRELGDRVKNVSMATFTADEVAAMERTNNSEFNAKWMARHTPGDMPLPNGAPDDRRREFLKAKYVEKRWYSGAGGDVSGSSAKPESPFQSSAPPAQGNPFSNVQASSGNPFVSGGQPAQGGNPFAQQSQPQPQPSNPFGQQPPQQSNPFGQQPKPAQPNPFGQQPKPAQPNPFGQQPPQQSNPFGQQPPQQSNPFGQQPPQQSNPFGQQPPQQSNPFGQPQQQPNLFASPQTQAPPKDDLFGDDLLDLCAGPKSPQPQPVAAPGQQVNSLKGLVDLMGPEQPMNAPVNSQTLRQAGLGTPLPGQQQPLGFPAQQPMGFPGQQPMGFPGQQPMGFPGQQPMGFPGQQPMGFPGQQPMNMQRGYQQNPFG